MSWPRRPRGGRGPARIFTDAARPLLAEKETLEAEIMRGYLPLELSAEELEVTARSALEADGLLGSKQMGLAVRSAMQAVDGRADGGAVSGVVRSLLG